MAQIPSPDGLGTRCEAEYDGSGNLIYFGTTAVGNATSAATWKIGKFTYDGSNNLLNVKWANGAQFTSVWNDRASLTYL